MIPSLEKIREKLTEARKAYYNEQPIMTDDEYDVLEIELRKQCPNDPLLSAVGATPTGIWQKKRHSLPMGSLTNPKSRGVPGIREWFETIAREIQAQ